MVKLKAHLPNGCGYRLVKEEDRVVTALKHVLVDCGRFTDRTIPIIKEWLETIDSKDVDLQAAVTPPAVTPPAVNTALPPPLERGQPGRRVDRKRGHKAGKGNK